MMIDLMGEDLKVGDVVVKHAGGRYHRFEAAVVIGFTPKMVKLRGLNRFDYVSPPRLVAKTFYQGEET